MFQYEKMLQYPVKIKNPNPAAAKFIMSQYGGQYSVSTETRQFIAPQGAALNG